MTGCPSKLVPIRFELPLGGVHERSLFVATILTTFHLFSLSSIPYIGSGIGFAKLAKGCTLPCGKKGLKAQRVKVASKR
jgi:hypothetical protein